MRRARIDPERAMTPEIKQTAQVAPPTPTPTLKKLNAKIAYQQSRKPARSGMPGRQPTRCPDCETSWVGLPRRGQCPECGFVYDENTRAWSGRRRIRPGTPMLLSLVSLALAVMYYDVGWVLVAVGLFLPGYLAWAVYDMLVARDGRFIATSPAGVVFRLRSHKTRTIPWSRVIFAEATTYRMPVFKVHGEKRTVRIRVHLALRNCREGCEFAAAVEDGIMRYSAGSKAR